MSAVRDQLRSLIAEIGEIDNPESIGDSADLYKDLGLDSMQAMEIVLEIEQRYNIAVPEQALRTIRTLDDAVKLVETLQKQ